MLQVDGHPGGWQGDIPKSGNIRFEGRRRKRNEKKELGGHAKNNNFSELLTPSTFGKSTPKGGKEKDGGNIIAGQL